MTDTTNEGEAATNGTNAKPREARQPRQRGPPEDGIPSKNKVMVANLPYDLSEGKVLYSNHLMMLNLTDSDAIA